MTTMPQRPLTITEAADTTGLTPRTLRHDERDGLLLRPVDRATPGHRRYTDRDLRWIEMITRLRATRRPIHEVRAHTTLVRSDDGNEPRRPELLCRHRDRGRAELAVGQDHLDAIEQKSTAHEAHVHEVVAEDRAG